MKCFKKLIVCLIIMTLTFSLPEIFSKKVEATVTYMNYSTYTMSAGYNVQLKVIGTSKKAKWSSSNKKVATVNKKGKVVGKKKGKCTITAKIGKKKYKCKMKILAPIGAQVDTSPYKKTTLDISSLKLDVSTVGVNSEGNAYLTKGKGTYKLKLFNIPKKGKKAYKVKWSSSNKKVATVSKGKITAKSKGSCTITAKVKGKKYKCSVTITDYIKDGAGVSTLSGGGKAEAEAIARQKNIYDMLAMINKARVKAKVAPLKMKESLNKIADIRVEEIAPKNIEVVNVASIRLDENFSHTRPDGTSFSTTYNEIGMKKGSIIGENCAFVSDKVEYMGNFTNMSFDALWNSKEHKKNMLSPKYQYVGIGYYQIDTYRDDFGALCVASFWVQEFYTK